MRAPSCCWVGPFPGRGLPIAERGPAERHAIKQLKPLYEKRRSVLKGIPKFWYQALMNCDEFAIHAQHEDDVSALSYLEDLWVERDATEPRCFTVEMVRRSAALYASGSGRRLMTRDNSTSRRTRTSATPCSRRCTSTRRRRDPTPRPTRTVLRRLRSTLTGTTTSSRRYVRL